MDAGLTETIDEFDVKAFGARLEILRHSRLAAERLGLPTVHGTDFAKLLGITKVRYYRYERGDIEPPIWVVSKIGRLTGVSLDWLMLGRTEHGERPEKVTFTVGDRLRFIREAVSPFIEECAGTFGVDPATWRDYEDGKSELPLAFANEVVGRFPITLDYLYRGDLAGLERQVRHVLLTAHPELRQKKNKQSADHPRFVPRLGQWPPTAETQASSAAGTHARSRKAADDDSRLRTGLD